MIHHTPHCSIHSLAPFVLHIFTKLFVRNSIVFHCFVYKAIFHTLGECTSWHIMLL